MTARRDLFFLLVRSSSTPIGSYRVACLGIHIHVYMYTYLYVRMYIINCVPTRTRDMRTGRSMFRYRQKVCGGPRNRAFLVLGPGM